MLRKWCLCLLILGLGEAGLSGCSSRSRQEEERFLKERERMRQDREAFRKELVTGREGEVAIQLAQSAPATDSKKNNKEWIQELVDHLDGQVLFPRWEASRSSPAAYEVCFTFTFIDRANALYTRGYAWDVNIMLRTAGPARELGPDELAAISRRHNLPDPHRRDPLDTLRVE